MYNGLLGCKVSLSIADELSSSLAMDESTKDGFEKNIVNQAKQSKQLAKGTKFLDFDFVNPN